MKKNNKQNLTVVFIVIGAIVIVGLVVLLLSGGSGSTNNTSVKGIDNSVTITADGTQEVLINVRGGYKPNLITLDANKPTRLKMVTKNTYDCSASVVIPSLGINKNLPSTGTTSFDIEAQKPGTEITGSCSMGMYAFKLKFI